MTEPSRASLPLWPIRYKPRDDELLSSWLIRLSHGMGLKVQTLCNLEFGNQRQVWNRDIDRLGPEWLIETLSQRTGTPLNLARQTTLRAYDGILYRRFKTSGILPWVLRLKMYHRTWRGHGLMFCPGCLADDEAPYYRRSWRIAMHTVCLRHRCMLMDRCPVCQAGVGFTRTDLGQPAVDEFPPLNLCHACGFDLSLAESLSPRCLDHAAAAWLTRLWSDFADGNLGRETVDRIRLLHVVGSLLTKHHKAMHLSAYVCDRLGVDRLPPDPGRTPLEARPVDQRHQLLQMAAWLLTDLRCRLGEALRDHAVRFNHLLRDFRNVPSDYRQTVLALPHRILASP